MSRWAVFLDRDGVVTDAPVVDGVALAPTDADDLTVLPGVADALRDLHEAGALLVLVTNQPDIARGKVDPAQVHQMHERLEATLPLDLVLMCPHSGHEGCACRKPSPGMLLDGADILDIDLARSWMVGDRWVDIAAGHAAGTTTVLVERDYSWKATSSGAPDNELTPDHTVADLAAAVPLMLRDG